MSRKGRVGIWPLVLGIGLIFLVGLSRTSSARTLRWGAERLIENNATDGIYPQVAISGEKVVAVWYQWYGGVAYLLQLLH